MSKYSHFLRKARNNADFSGLRAGIKLIVMILVVVYSLIGMSPTSVLAAAPVTYYVNNTVPCNDLSSDTTTVPFCTISRGGAVARFGDTVRVLAGTYPETVSLSTWSGTPGNPITFSAAPGVIVTAGTGTTSAFRFFNLSYMTIDGFTVNSTLETGIYVWGNHLIISNNHVTGTVSHGIYVVDSNNVTVSNNQVSTSTGGSGIYFKNSSASTVSGNTSDHNNLDGIRLHSSNTVTVSDNTTFANSNNGIAAISTSYTNTILHNIVYANTDSGLQFDTGSHDNSVVGNLSYNNGDHGIDNNAATNQTIVGNTFQGNYTSGINLVSVSTGATVANNILVDNGLAPSAGNPYNIYVDSTSVTGTTLDYNLYYLTSPYIQQIYWNATGYNSLAAFKLAVPTQEVHGLQADPLFTAPAAPATDPPSVTTGDYHITAGSPAIDSANSGAPSEPTLDILGNSRVDDPATSNTGTGPRAYDDRGAYEFQPGMTAPTVTTQAVTSIGTTTATGNGNVTVLGVPNPTAHGVVWNMTGTPTIADSKTDLGAKSTTGAFTASMTGLTPGTLYYVRAFATNTAGTSYGGEVTFTSLQLPTVTTQAVSSIGTTTATGNGNVTVLGVPNPTAHGVVWNMTGTPTIADSKTDLGAKSTTGAFTASMTGLTPGTLYYVRAFATNTAGTSYGGEVTFTSLQLPTVTTQAVSSIGTTTATGNGNVTVLGVPNPTAHGVVWNMTGTPTIADSKTDLGAKSTTGAFTASMTGLTPGTLYYVRAFATNTAGTSYGGEVTFTSLQLPTVTTQAVSSIGTTTATGNGNVTVLGVPNPTAHGVVWNMTGTPTIADSKTDLGAKSTTGAFTASMTGLTPGTLYYVRAFATNTAGTSYGGEVTFTSLQLPTVTTQAVSSIGTTTATGNGNVTVLGVPNPTAHGVVWNMTGTPTIADSKTDLGAKSTTGAFTASMTGLTPGTLYYVRAFATNMAGTSYGGEVTFTSLQLPTVTTQAVSSIGTTTATGNGNVTVLGVPNPTAHGVVWNMTGTPTIADSKTDLGAKSTTGAFTASMTGLTPGTLYYVRAFATNTAGTSYGGEVTFTSLQLPTVTTQAVSSIGTTTATGNGNVTVLGVPNPTAHGVVWNMTGTPTIADSKTDLGAKSTTGAFTASMTGLTPGTLYHVRAYATNTAGTSYGSEVTFTALPMVATTTAVNCGAGTPIVTYGSSITCVATVVRASGSNTPTGNVSWVTGGSGNFVTSPCALSGSGGTATCSVTYTPSSVGTGTHQITATYAGDLNFQGSNNFQNVTVNKAAATVTLGSLAQTYDGTPKSVTAITSPFGLTVDFTYNGSATAPTNAGSYAVVGTINDTNYAGSASGTLVIAKAAATVTLSNLEYTYDGLAKLVNATTNPLGLTVNLTYDGSATAPTNAGSYAVVGTINDTNYAGSASGTLVIAKAAQTITFGALAAKTLGDADFSVSATASSGLPVDFSTSTPSVCTVTADGVTLHLAALGTCTITAHQAGNGNYNVAADVPRSFNVAAANVAPEITEGASVNVNMSQDGSPTPFSLTLNATDVNGDTLTWSISSLAGHGTASASGTGTSMVIAYTPALNYIGSDSFVVQVSDGHGGTDTITVNVTITAVEPTSFTIFLPLILR